MGRGAGCPRGRHTAVADLGSTAGERRTRTYLGDRTEGGGVDPGGFARDSDQTCIKLARAILADLQRLVAGGELHPADKGFKLWNRRIAETRRELGGDKADVIA